MIEKRDVLIVARTWKRKVKIDIGDPTRDEIDNNIMGILLRNYGRPSAEPAEMLVVVHHRASCCPPARQQLWSASVA